MTPIGLGLRAIRGGSVVVGVSTSGREPRVVLSTFLPTAAEGDRLAREPYHVASEIVRGADRDPSTAAAAAVTEGRKRQDALAAKELSRIVRELRSAKSEPVVAALLVNRAGWVTDLLAYSLAFPDHPPVAEGLAVRDALRFAIRQAGLEIVEMDEKTLLDLAREVLRPGSIELVTRLKNLGANVGKPWRKEQKLAALAAWLAIVSRR